MHSEERTVLKRSIPLILTACAIVLHAALPVCAQQANANPPAEENSISRGTHNVPCPQDPQKAEDVRYNDYSIHIGRGPGELACLQISRQGRVVYSLASNAFQLGGNFAGSAKIPIGTDILGTGRPDAVIAEWTGDEHCCFVFHIFELGPRLRQVALIDAKDSEIAGFIDLRHDGSYDFVGYDRVFADWRTSAKDSPAPRIALKYRRGRFRMDFDFMATPMPSNEEFASIVRGVQTDEDWCTSADQANCEGAGGVPVTLWKNMLDLMYGGHEGLAWRLLDESWPPQKPGKPDFVEQFCRLPSSSDYWHDLKTMIAGCANPQPAPLASR
jgi:hypothetical protein